MKYLKAATPIFTLLCMLLVVPSTLPQDKNAAALNQVLKKMDAVGRTFRTFTAHFTQKQFITALNEFGDPESGEFYYARSSDGSALLRQEFTKPGVRILTIQGGQAVLYQPSVKQAQIINLGKNKDKAEYLAIGLGQSPAKLQETFTIRYQGTDNVNGAACSVLVLKPKSAKVSALYASISLWINKAGIPIQDKLQEPSGDYMLITFSGEKLNTKIPDSKFEQKLPAGVEKQVIQ